ncbi:uncharacterized protein PADG_02071 [Paracoccidioides brasiliensis Pb18]|uniref:GST N-terminal domain-containing protein n=1 Tax=Paracoccidioides brasiliensis (strain Pb18) TaxID=502780 RepID=C1G1Q5_PARBD|nr:uncharacterized protein PADG_02071 [Paracoccidioides brasiliensis Pb18]EEH45921.2 hypothetical protein PADG_02071 [Paracoccidioides brasiliensis Pb18]
MASKYGYEDNGRSILHLSNTSKILPEELMLLCHQQRLSSSFHAAPPSPQVHDIIPSQDAMSRHPVATGAAKALVDKHAAELPLKLYAGWFCPYIRYDQTPIHQQNIIYQHLQRTWITLEEKKIPYQYIEINPYDKSPSFLALNPKGLVPTLVAPQPNNKPSKPLYESNIIDEYLEEAFPDNTPHLLPQDPYERARARIWINFVDSRITPTYRKLQLAKTTEDLHAARGEFLKALKEFTRAMHGEGPYFCGGEIGLTDVALAPWAVRFWKVEKFKEGGLGIPAEGKGEEDEGVWARWRKWEKAVLGRESVKNTLSEREYYESLAKMGWAKI